MREKLSQEKVSELKRQANAIRISIIEMLVAAGSGHSAGPLGMADIFTALYFHILKHDPFFPNWSERDRLVLSNGHICPVLYATMAHAKYFPAEELYSLRKFGSRLQGHPHREFLPMLENSSGPLGSGLSQAIGMAVAMRIDSKSKGETLLYTEGFRPSTVYCLMSDGELNEGNSWEAIMLAGKERLDNLIAIVDRNNIQIDGNTEDIMPLEPLRHKWESFGWHVVDIDGHDFNEIIGAVNEAKRYHSKPSVIIAHTIPGKGVSYMEGKYEWHGKPPSKEEAEVALRELRVNL